MQGRHLSCSFGLGADVLRTYLQYRHGNSTSTFYGPITHRIARRHYVHGGDLHGAEVGEKPHPGPVDSAGTLGGGCSTTARCSVLPFGARWPWHGHHWGVDYASEHCLETGKAEVLLPAE